MIQLRLPLSVWALSFSSLFLNITSVIVFGCSPILLIRYFGLSDLDAGIIEGTVEGFALTVRAFAGIASDFLEKRRAFLLWGFSIMAFSRFILAPATYVNMVLASRLIEKLGNGLQASPREALISDVTDTHLLGRAYGLNKTFSMSGSVIGSFLMLFVFIYQRDFDVRLLLWAASAFSLISVFVLWYGVKDPKFQKLHKRCSWKEKCKRVIKDLKEFPPVFWKLLGIVCLFKLGYLSGTFFMCILRNSHATFLGTSLYNEHGLSNSIFLIVQNLSCVFFAYPFGKISDNIDRRLVVGFGFVLLVTSIICFTFIHSPTIVCIGVILYGIQMAVQGAILALLATTMPTYLHGTGFGLYFLASGISIIISNHIFMKNLVNIYGIPVALFTLAGFIALALVFLPFIHTFDQKHAKSEKTI